MVPANTYHYGFPLAFLLFPYSWAKKENLPLTLTDV